MLSFHVLRMILNMNFLGKTAIHVQFSLWKLILTREEGI